MEREYLLWKLNKAVNNPDLEVKDQKKRATWLLGLPVVLIGLVLTLVGLTVALAGLMVIGQYVVVLMFDKDIHWFGDFCAGVFVIGLVILIFMAIWDTSKYIGKELQHKLKKRYR